MNLLLIFFFLFSVGSVMGWCIELIYRRFFSTANPERKWINPGFLVGPCLPLYGSGLCALYLLANIPVDFIKNGILQKIFLFVVMMLVMTLIEYVTGLVFIVRMHVKLWDYSEDWGNIQGIICPLFSFFWGVLGFAYYLLLHPYVLQAVDWLDDHLAFLFLIGMFYGVFCVDLGYSFNFVKKIRQFADDYELIVKYEELKKAILIENEKITKKGRFIFALRSEIPLHGHAKRYLELQKTFSEYEIKEKLEKAAERVKDRSAAVATRANQAKAHAKALFDKDE